MRKLIMKLCMIWLAFFVAFSMQKERAQAAVTEVEPMTVGSLKTAAGAQDFSYSGICGDGLTWTFKEEMLTGASYAYILRISGTGPMYDYPYTRYPEAGTEAPWIECLNSVCKHEEGGYASFHIIIEEGVTSIGAGAFTGLSFAYQVTIPSSIKIIGDGAFHDFSCHDWSFNSMEGFWTNGIEIIGDDAFSEADIRDVVLPDSIRVIGASAFASCSNMRNITIPNGTESIGERAFYGSGLQAISIPECISELWNKRQYKWRNECQDGLWHNCWE